MKGKMERKKREEGRHKGMKAGRDRGRRSKWRERGKRLWGEKKAHKGSNGKRLTPQVDTQH